MKGALAFVAAAAAFAFAGDGDENDGPSVGDAAPAFKLTVLKSDKILRLKSLRGKPTVLIFGSYT